MRLRLRARPDRKLAFRRPDKGTMLRRPDREPVFRKGILAGRMRLRL